MLKISHHQLIKLKEVKALNISSKNIKSKHYRNNKLRKKFNYKTGYKWNGKELKEEDQFAKTKK